MVAVMYTQTLVEFMPRGGAISVPVLVLAGSCKPILSRILEVGVLGRQNSSSDPDGGSSGFVLSRSFRLEDILILQRCCHESLALVEHLGYEALQVWRRGRVLFGSHLWMQRQILGPQWPQVDTGGGSGHVDDRLFYSLFFSVGMDGMTALRDVVSDAQAGVTPYCVEMS